MPQMVVTTAEVVPGLKPKIQNKILKTNKPSTHSFCPPFWKWMSRDQPAGPNGTAWLPKHTGPSMRPLLVRPKALISCHVIKLRRRLPFSAEDLHYRAVLMSAVRSRVQSLPPRMNRGPCLASTKTVLLSCLKQPKCWDFTPG